MRIKSAHIQGFRCLHDVKIEFDELTTLIGPNGVGKSSILRALNWFFNGEEKKTALTNEDVCQSPKCDEIQVVVTFDELTETDREALTMKYAPPGVSELVVSRTWNNGDDKMTGVPYAFPAFEEVRAGESAADRAALFNTLRQDQEDLELPNATTDAARLQVMLDWERANPTRLEPAGVSSTHLFGFAGQAVLSGIFDFVLVSADLRASEETTDAKGRVVGRILEKAIDRSSATDELKDLSEEFAERHNQINATHFEDQLVDISKALSAEIGQFTTGRSIAVAADEAEFSPKSPTFEISVLDGEVTTSVDRQGHGFQRSLLMSALKYLAEAGNGQDDETVVCLAIEEPELFQHPTQARAFARVLRELATSENAGLQVCYATHSPYFVQPQKFGELRRISRKPSGAGAAREVVIHHASEEDVRLKLADYVSEKALNSQMDNVFVSALAEALFAEAVLLVEGSTDDALVAGAAARTVPLEVAGISIAATNGKASALLPAAILGHLGIPFHLLLDADSGIRARAIAGGKDEGIAEDVERESIRQNRLVLKYFDETEEDWPTNWATGQVSFLADRLEDLLQNDWSSWESARERIVEECRGVPGKNAATYYLASLEADDEPPEALASLISHLVSLIGE